MASVTEEARRQANLKLLQRTCDPTIQSILQTATHVVLYEFKNNTWAKCGVEGSCFLVACPTSVKLVILNRHSAHNFVMEVVGQLQVQEQDPFLISQEPHIPRTSGIWFHSADERRAMTNRLQSTIAALAAGTFEYHSSLTSSGNLAASNTAIVTAASTTMTTTTTTTTMPEVTQDERDHLAALLSQTAMMAATANNNSSSSNNNNNNNNNTRSHSAPILATPVSKNINNPQGSSPLVAGGSGSGGGVALDKKALQLTLLSLIQDERFLDLLHSQYLRVVHARAKKSNDNNGSS